MCCDAGSSLGLEFEESRRRLGGFFHILRIDTIYEVKHMKKNLSIKKTVCVLTALLAAGLSWQGAEACTTTIVTKGATADGSTLVTHSNDAFTSDPNIVYVPAKEHQPGEMRKVYPAAIAWDEMPEYNCREFPRLVAPERAEDYARPGQEPTKPLGEIPEAAHTYAYIDSDYGVMNEHGLMLGECTNNSAHLEYLEPGAGRGIFYASELGRVALERCRTAREAVELMGSLIDEYGLWGTGETLLVADKDEGWVLEMQPTPSGKGGFWIAQRVPDGEFFVAANQFRIHAIKKGDPNQIYNPKLPETLKEAGWAAYDKQGNLDWVRSMQAVEDYHPYFALHRVWRAQSLVAPSTNLPQRTKGWEGDEYPFSVKPDHPLTLQEVMDLHRDAYEGTSIDRRKGKAAGLFDSVYRYGDYQWERAITSRSNAYTWITQAGASLPCPIFWLSMNAPAESTYVPLTVSQMPEAYRHIDRGSFDVSKAWWASGQVTALTRGYYSVLQPEVLSAAHELEAEAIRLVNSSAGQSPEDFRRDLEKNAAFALDRWQRLQGELLAKHQIDRRMALGSAQELTSDPVQKY